LLTNNKNDGDGSDDNHVNNTTADQGP